MAEDLFAPVIRMVGRTPEDRDAFRAWLSDHDRQVAAQTLVEARASVIWAYERMGQSEEAAAWIAWIAGLLADLAALGITVTDGGA